ncbi:BTAD domain-containing putative transcriptional regulator [Streptomyces axinellae]|uniref:BTAD domain-containing putative transcriptional regulator n=1 Tax=Streptomyces axinellae TaxID=552788 RepID=A0ABP6CL19_9ACTN
MIFVALGSPLELWDRGEQFPLGSVKQRCVLAVLLHARGEPVAAGTVIDRVWGDEAPEKATESLRAYVSRSRGVLASAVGDRARIAHRSPGLYQLLVDDEDVDLHRFQRLRADARAAAGRGERRMAIGLLNTAESMWHGEPFAEFSSDWGYSVRSRLHEDLRGVREERIRLALDMGQHAELVGELLQLAAEYPTAQGLIGLLMTALYRCGRTEEALGHYLACRRQLRDGLGIEPGAELSKLHGRILEQDQSLLRPEGVQAAAAVPRAARPAAGPRNNLPRDIRDFTGRARELSLLAGTAERDGRTSGITVIHGMPGVGKTALALRAAHQLASRYPDGVFYVELRGYDDQPRCEPAEALGLLLGDAEAPHDRESASLDEWTRRWREWTARHRALLILDDARDERQVGPLLPVGPGCRAIITSRNRLRALEGVNCLPLDVLTESDATTLFTRIVGDARVPESGALRRAVGVFGGHPLSIQLLASGFRHRESWDLGFLADRVGQAADPLSELEHDVVGSAFRLSYTALGESAQRLFRRLALHPGPDLTVSAAAALAELDAGSVRRALATLLDHHLVDEPLPERYALHDLARAFGRRLCEEEDPVPVRRDAFERLLDHYLSAADRADRAAHPRRRRLPLGPSHARPDAGAPDFGSAEEASAWLWAERSNLLAVARSAARRSPRHARLFPHVLAQALKLWAVWDIAAELHGAAVCALRTVYGAGARSGADAMARELAQALVEMADVAAQQSHEKALGHAVEAASLFARCGDDHGRAAALFQAGRAHLAAGRQRETLGALEMSLRLYRAVGDEYGEAEALNVEGVALHYAGDYEQALERFRQVFAIHERAQDPFGEATALNNIGEIYCLEGRYEAARRYFEEALTRVRRVGGHLDVALVDGNLGAVHQATGATGPARACYLRALTSYRRSGDASGEADTLILLGSACAEARRFGEAAEHLRMAEEVARGVGNVYECQRAVCGLADVQRQSGHFEAAQESYEESLGMAREIDFTRGIAQALDGMARTALALREAGQAARYGREAIALYARLEATAEAASLRDLLGEAGATGP